DVVEADHYVTGQLHHWGLVIAHRHEVSVHEHDVGGLRDRVAEETERHLVLHALLAYLVLDGGVAFDACYRHQVREKDGQFGNLGYERLYNDSDDVGVEAHRQIV